MADLSWKQTLGDRIPPTLGQEIDFFEAQVALRKAGKIDEKVFAETRLRRGAYGQRYDNGQRHDGITTRKLPYNGLTKGPDTYFDAPGMEADQGAVRGAERRAAAGAWQTWPRSTATASVHITTRQDVQLHFVQVDEAAGHVPPAGRRRYHDPRGVRQQRPQRDRLPVGRRLPDRGVRRDAVRKRGGVRTCSATATRRTSAESSRSPSAAASTRRARWYRSTTWAGLPRCRMASGGSPCTSPAGWARCRTRRSCSRTFVPEAAAAAAEPGHLPRVRPDGGEEGPEQGPAEVLGAEAGNRQASSEIVQEEYRTHARADPTAAQRTSTSHAVGTAGEAQPGSRRAAERCAAPRRVRPPGRRPTSTSSGRAGMCVATVTCPLGDLSSEQTRDLADLSPRSYAGGHTCGSPIEQNIVLRWVPGRTELVDLYTDLAKAGRPGRSPEPGQHRGRDRLPRHRHVQAGHRQQPRAWPASCGSSWRLQGGVAWTRPCGACGSRCPAASTAAASTTWPTSASTATAATSATTPSPTSRSCSAASGGTTAAATPWRWVPCLASGSPQLVTALTDRYVAERQGEADTFQAWCGRIGKKQLKTIARAVRARPGPQVHDASFYTDWGDPREFTIGDLGTGECAGEVVSLQPVRLQPGRG